MATSGRLLQDLKRSYKSTGLLLPVLERHVLREASKPTDRSSNLLHPSQIAKSDWCHRRDYYQFTNPVDQPVQTSFRSEMIFANGHDRHRYYQQQLWRMGVLWGMWQCKDCRSLWFDLSPEKCCQCASERLKYREVPLSDQSRLIEGHADAVVVIDGKWYLVEIKTVGLGTVLWENQSLYREYQNGLSLEQLWYRIQRPFASHLRQGMLYRWLIEDFGLPMADEIIVLYEWKPDQSVKEFILSYQPNLIADRLQRAQEVWKAVYHGRPPERPEWVTDEFSTRCKECEHVRTCWASPDPTPNGPAVRVARSTSRRRRKFVPPS